MAHMFTDSSIAFLKKLLDTPGPSGFESAPARVWREEAARFAQDVRGDVAGNSIATITPARTGGRRADLVGSRSLRSTKSALLPPANVPTIMLAGHIDEIGIIVNYIDDEGFLYISSIGGWDTQVLVGQRLRIMGRKGDVFGVIGKKPIHLMKDEEQRKVTKFTDMWVDIGARSKKEAQQMVSVGDAGVIDSRTMEFPNGRLVSRSIDDRIGAFIVLEALRRYAKKPGKARVVAVATTQEEIAWRGGGAIVCASCVNPQMAIVVDVTFAADHPQMEKKEIGEAKLDGGPVLARGSVISPVVFNILRSCAERNKMPYSVHAVGRDTSTDADAIHIAREGVATGLVSVPNRYMHSPNEMVTLADLDRAATLLAEACRAVDEKTDFTAR